MENKAKIRKIKCFVNKIKFFINEILERENKENVEEEIRNELKKMSRIEVCERSDCR